jgi:predicted 2-oxoglutarate/Fe(II)-dependent dioxygenase YbiX
MLIPIKQVLSKDEVSQFRAHLEQAAWQDGLKTAGTLASAVKRNEQLDDGAEPALSLGKHILRKLSNQSGVHIGGPSEIASTRPNSIVIRMAAPMARMSTAP